MKKYAVLATIFTVLFVVALSGLALAQGEIGHRIHKQQRRINDGVRTGMLTHREANVLQDNLDHIRRTYDRARRDGVLTYREEDRLMRMLDDNGRMIERMKHNIEVRRLY